MGLSTVLSSLLATRVNIGNKNMRGKSNHEQISLRNKKTSAHCVLDWSNMAIEKRPVAALAARRPTLALVPAGRRRRRRRRFWRRFCHRRRRHRKGAGALDQQRPTAARRHGLSEQRRRPALPAAPPVGRGQPPNLFRSQFSFPPHCDFVGIDLVWLTVTKLTAGILRCSALQPILNVFSLVLRS